MKAALAGHPSFLCQRRGGGQASAAELADGSPTAISVSSELSFLLSLLLSVWNANP